MLEQSYHTKYDEVQANYITIKGISFTKIKSKYDEKQTFLMRKINRNCFFSKEHFLSYTRTKWINILDPVDIFEKDDKFLIVFQNLIDYQLTDNKLKNCSENCIRKILLQLALTFEEMIRRKIKWNIFTLDQIYKINNNYILMSISDFQDNYFSKNYDIFESFQNFLNESICQSFPVFKRLRSLRTFKEIISDLLSSLGININPNDLSQTTFLTEDSPLLQILKIYFNPNIVDQSDVFQSVLSFELDTPDIFKQVFGIKSNTIEKRSYKLIGEMELINQDREIEYQVLVKNCPNIQSAFCYVRIFQQAIFFFSQPASSLQESLNQALQIDNLTYKKTAYKILNDIIFGIHYLHNLNIIHRNITLETCFLAEKILDNQNVYLIGKLSSSKRLSSKNIQIESTSLNTNSSSIFMPPDNQKEYSIKADLYQFGLLSLFVLNKGKLLFNYTGLSKNEINQQFSVQNLSKLLEPFGYATELIETISQCLKYHPMDRPETEQVYKVIQKVYLNSKIKILSQSIQKS